jgi:hypothetical protein
MRVSRQDPKRTMNCLFETSNWTEVFVIYMVEVPSWLVLCVSVPLRETSCLYCARYARDRRIAKYPVSARSNGMLVSSAT